MPTFAHYSSHQKIEGNEIGRDFVVGDLHGCYDDLMLLLNAVQFDKSRDRMFTVGDLVDRGPKSAETFALIHEHWFYSTRGNHEDFMITGVLKNIGDTYTWMANGGVWAASVDNNRLYDMALDATKLPLMITVGDGDQRFHVGHAEFRKVEGGHSIVPLTEDDLDQWPFRDHDEMQMMWGRQLISSMRRKSHPGHWHDPALAPIYVGHTPVFKPVQVCKQIYIDGGAVYKEDGLHSLIVAEPSAEMFYILNTLTGTVREMPFSEMICHY